YCRFKDVEALKFLAYHTEFIDCTFHSCKFLNTNFEASCFFRCSMMNDIFSRCNFKDTVWKYNLQHCLSVGESNFKDIYLEGGNISGNYSNTFFTPYFFRDT